MAGCGAGGCGRVVRRTAIQAVEFQSPRGPFRFSKARNPVQNIYAIEAKGGHLRVLETMKSDVEDPTADCKA